MEKKEITKPLDEACKFLGSEYDPLVCYNFPHTNNYCYRCKKPCPINISHQENFCLSINHSECSIIQAEGIKRLPSEIARKPKFANRISGYWYIVFIAGIILIAGLFSWIFIGNFNIPPFALPPQVAILAGKTPDTTNMPQNVSTIEGTATITVMASGTIPPDQTPSPENGEQITPTQGPGFATPFGLSRRYLIHEVGVGESLHYIATLYNTSTQSVVEINSLLAGYPIWLGQILVVQRSSTDPSEKLNAILIEAPTPLQSIAEQYNTSTEKLIDLNALGDQDAIPAGRWLIVPSP